ncbi:MAG: hypothetical protein ACT4PG_00770 [Panacagrimonas sp.]
MTRTGLVIPYRFAFGLLLTVLATSCASRKHELDPSLIPPTFEEFERADLDASGKLSRSEAQPLPFVDRYFANIDVDDNALISWDETRNFAIAGPVRDAGYRRKRSLPDD